MMTRPGQQLVFAGFVHSFPEIFSLQLARGKARRENPAGIWPLEARLFCAPAAFVHNRYCLFVLR